MGEGAATLRYAKDDLFDAALALGLLLGGLSLFLDQPGLAALLTGVAFVISYLLKAPMALAVTMTGAVITLWGGVMLARFVRRYPQECALADGN